ncbi:MAG TPA: hypothetical protein VFC44_23930 [Candidatus Saccharimonadales bacterium]|nr:hypothetical protein [Candidatus Saccharimonadales bacterium]
MQREDYGGLNGVGIPLIAKAKKQGQEMGNISFCPHLFAIPSRHIAESGAGDAGKSDAGAFLEKTRQKSLPKSRIIPRSEKIAAKVTFNR